MPQCEPEPTVRLTKTTAISCVGDEHRTFTCLEKILVIFSSCTGNVSHTTVSSTEITVETS